MNRNIIELNHTRFWWTNAIVGFIGLTIGTVSSLVRSMASHNGTHYEAVVEFFVLMPILSLVIIWGHLRLTFKSALPAISLQLSFLWLFDLAGRAVAPVVASVFGMNGVEFLDDFIFMIILFWIGSIALGLAIYGVIYKVFPLRVSGTSCPTCGYSLKGLGASGKCPECGVAFTAESLGVSEAELGV